MTDAQRAAFEQISINRFPEDGWASIDALLQAGLIERGPDETRRDAMGTYKVVSFAVPIPVHYRWCLWCSEQPHLNDL